MRRLIAALAIGGSLLFSVVSPAAAAPITCPPGQTVTKVGTAWECVNNGDSGNPSTEETKNPNDKVLSDEYLTLIGAASSAADATLAAVEKVGVCHLSREDGKYEYIEVPAKQFTPTKSGHLKGHARHAALGFDRLGLSEEECLALNEPA